MTWVLLLFFGGVTLIVAEFFLPGMVCGAVGALMLIGGVGYGVFAFPDYALWIAILYFLGTALAIVGGVVIFPHTWAGRRMILSDAITAEEGYVSDPSDTSLLGQIGQTYSPLRPAGTVMVGEKRLQAVSGGEYIEQGVNVRVLEVHGNRIVVERAEA